ncbi:hypothetical protein CR983_04075 [Candidatus Saccharibacteria bacterium]|nr:MAG: hypothetical protein CR983_04075 [Candidatus Saccharibacteria bacterium]
MLGTTASITIAAASLVGFGAASAEAAPAAGPLDVRVQRNPSPPEDVPFIQCRSDGKGGIECKIIYMPPCI